MGAKHALASVGLTLGFHLASFTFGVFLCVLFGLTGSTVLLLLVCLLSGSSRSVRVFVAFLWRMEMRINALANQEDGDSGRERQYDRRHRHHHEHHHVERHSQPAQPQTAPPQREVTMTVMIVSLLYFLLFKWVLNLIFSFIPLALWFVCFVQLLPAGSALAAESFVASDSVAVKIFTAVAFAFFAHQLGVSAAHGLCFVSNKVTAYLFDSTTGNARITEPRGFIFQSSLFAGAPGFMEMMPMQPGSAQFFPTGRPVSEYGAVAHGERHASTSSSASAPDVLNGQPDRAAASLRQREPEAARGSDEDASPFARYAAARPASMMNGERSASMPQMPPMPPFQPRFGPHLPRSESDFRRAGGVEEQEINMCGIKIVVKKDTRPDWERERRGHGGEWDRERRAREVEWERERRGHGRRGGGRPAGGRGWDRSDVPLARVVLPDEASESPRGLDHDKAHYDDSFEHGLLDKDARPAVPSAPALASPMSPISPISAGPYSEPREVQQAQDTKVSASSKQRDQERRLLPGFKTQSSDHDESVSEHEQVDDATISSSSSAHSATEQRRAKHVKASRKPTTTLPRAHSGDSDDDDARKPTATVDAAQSAGKASDEPLTARLVELKEHERYADEISQTVDELVIQQQAELLQRARVLSSATSSASSLTESKDGSAHGVRTSPLVASTAAPMRRRPLSGGGSDRRVHTTSRSSSSHDTVEQPADERAVSFVQSAQTGVSFSEPDITDSEIHGAFGSVPRYEVDDDDVMGLRQFAPSGGSLEYVTTLDTSRKYRDYDAFSPASTPTNFRTGDSNSFLDSAPEYDLLSPTNSIQDGEFPSEKFQQVYRSIQRTGGAGVASSTTGLTRGFEDDVLDRRDRVNFSAFAPPAVSPMSTTPFIYSVWAFLLSQRADMYERAQTELPEARRLSLDAKLDVRRGALVHVTLEVPDGFRILNGATQGFAWEGKISNVKYQVECSEQVPMGPVLFKARIVVGAEVAVLRSYVVVSSSGSALGEPESAELLESTLEVLEKTYREIPYRSLELKELVGQGYFGDAYRALFDGQEVVVKTIRSSEFGETSTQIVKEFQHEAAVLNMFGHHPCVVPFVGASTDVHFPLCLVTKYLPYGSLEDHLRKPNPDAQYSITQKTGMLKDAAAGLLNIHEGGFIHRDIAARNCLVDDNLHVRVCDFGLCRRVNASGSGLMRDAFGPVKYMAPESLQPPHVFSYTSDAYMFGVLMWETYTSSPPFPSMTPVEAMMRITRGERLTVPETLPEELRLLMETCFRDSPQERPTMGEILASLDDSLSAMTSKVTDAVAAAAVAAATASMSSASSASFGRRDRSIWV